jgi:hypothetical protein
MARSCASIFSPCPVICKIRAPVTV